MRLEIQCRGHFKSLDFPFDFHGNLTVGSNVISGDILTNTQTADLHNFLFLVNFHTWKGRLQETQSGSLLEFRLKRQQWFTRTQLKQCDAKLLFPH